MSRRNHAVTFTMAAADPDGVCQSQTPGGAGNLTINGALASAGVATFAVPRHVSITSAANDSGRTFTVTGTDRYGNVVSETITGPNTTTVTGVLNYATITQVAIDAASAGALTVGSADEADTEWFEMSLLVSPTAISIGGYVSSGASLAWGVQDCMEDYTKGSAETVQANAHGSLVTEAGAATGGYSLPVQYVRFAITSFVSGTFYGNILQAGYKL